MYITINVNPWLNVKINGSYFIIFDILDLNNESSREKTLIQFVKIHADYQKQIDEMTF